MLQANLFIGLGLLSTAYALKLGGWMALLGLAANAACFATAGEHSYKNCSALLCMSAACLLIGNERVRKQVPVGTMIPCNRQHL